MFLESVGFDPYREGPLVFQKESLLHCTPIKSCLCFSITASFYASFCLVFPIVINPSFQPPSHTPQYTIFSATFLGQVLNGSELAANKPRCHNVSENHRRIQGEWVLSWSSILLERKERLNIIFYLNTASVKWCHILIIKILWSVLQNPRAHTCQV